MIKVIQILNVFQYGEQEKFDFLMLWNRHLMKNPLLIS
jgi:hypothetical protein